MEIEKIVNEHSDGFEDVLCKYLNKINDEQCPKDVGSCSNCIRTIIRILSKD